MTWVEHIPYFVPYAIGTVFLAVVAWRYGVPVIQARVIEQQRVLIETLEKRVSDLTTQVDGLLEKLAKAEKQVEELLAVIELKRTNGQIDAIRRQRKAS